MYKFWPNPARTRGRGLVGSYGSVWTREEECKVEEGREESGRENKKNGDINRIPQNMWESRDEGPASREGPTEGSRILQPSKKKKKHKLRQRTPPT